MPSGSPSTGSLRARPWLRNLLGPGCISRLLRWRSPAAAAGAVAICTLAFGSDISTYLEADGTLQYPLGYRNANAAFFAIAAWPALALAQTGQLRWYARAARWGRRRCAWSWRC